MSCADGTQFGGAPRTAPRHRHPTISVWSANCEVLWNLLRDIVIALVLTRSICDPIFDLSGGGRLNGGLGLGAVVNLLAVVVAVMLLVQRPLTTPAAVFGSWAPFLLMAGAATLYAPEFTAAARFGFGFLTYWAFFVIPFFILRTREDLSRFMLAVLASSIAPSLYAVWDIRRAVSDMHDFRLESTFSHPNIFAFYLVMLLGVALYVRSSRAIHMARGLRTLIALYMPVLAVFLALTKTRSAWLACGAMFVVYAVRVDRRFLACFLFVPLLFVADPSLIARVTDLTKSPDVESIRKLNADHQLNSFAWRKALWEAAIPAILAEPLLGHGLESFKPATPELTPLAGREGMDAHNLYLQVAFEMGGLGLLSLLWLLASVGWRIARAWRQDRDGVLVALSILGAYALECYSDNMAYYLAFNWYFWFVMGAICAWIEYDRKHRTPVAPAGRRAGPAPARRPAFTPVVAGSPPTLLARGALGSGRQRS